MNIYNKLFVIEYSKDPSMINYHDGKYWLTNLSKNKYLDIHRNFDLYAIIYKNNKYWYKHSQKHRLIGPSIIDKMNYIKIFKSYYIKNKHFKTIYI